MEMDDEDSEDDDLSAVEQLIQALAKAKRSRKRRRKGFHRRRSTAARLLHGLLDDRAPLPQFGSCLRWDDPMNSIRGAEQRARA